MAEAVAYADGYEISINGLTYTHREGSSPSLADVTIHLPKGSRTILVGANGGESFIHLCERLRFSVIFLLALD